MAEQQIETDADNENSEQIIQKKNRTLFIKKYIIPLSIDLVNFKQY
mgnify:CR=1 FL=1